MVLLSGSGFKLMKAEIQSQTAITDLAAFLPGCNFTTISFTSQHESQVINTQCEHYPSIHLFIFVCFPGVGSRWQQAEQGIQGVPFHNNDFQLLQGDPGGQMRYIIPPASSGSARGLLPVGDAQKISKGRSPGGILSDDRTTSAGAFQCEGAAALL